MTGYQARWQIAVIARHHIILYLKSVQEEWLPASDCLRVLEAVQKGEMGTPEEFGFFDFDALIGSWT